MSRYRLTWTEVAQRGVEGIFDYVAERDNLDTAMALCERLRAAASTLETMPERCRVVPELRVLGTTEFRELILKPFHIPFRLRPGEVVIVGVLDGRRKLDEILLERALNA